MNAKRQINVEFPEPIFGYWDGGKKRGGIFEVEDCRKHPGPGKLIRWGCWNLNFFFSAKSGSSWGAAKAAAIKRLRNIITYPGTKIS